MSEGYSAYRAELVERGKQPPLRPILVPRPPRGTLMVPSFDDVRATLGMRRVLTVTAEVFGIDPSRMFEASRYKAVVRPRQAAVHLLRKMTRHSYPQIGRFLGLDHSTAIHCVRATERRLQTDAEFRARYTKAEKKLVHEAFLRLLGPVAISQYALAMEMLAIEANW